MSEQPTKSEAPSSGDQPYVPAHVELPEITVGVVGLAIVLAIILGAANAYLGLLVGMTVSASIPAAVISMAILRMVGGNILQNNAVQTAASAGESLAAGVIFTMPALVILGAWSEFDFLETLMIAGLGGLLGVLFTVPLRRALIVEQPLKFPEGVATAEVLKVGAQGGAGVIYLLVAGLIGALYKLGAGGLKLWSEKAVVAKEVGGSIAYMGSNLSPALIAVGFIVRLNIAVLIAIGGAINWLIAIPIFAATHDWPAPDALGAAEGIWSSQTRYLGVGAMLVGGLWALIRLRAPLVAGVRASMDAYRKSRETHTDDQLRTERDTPLPVVMVLAAVALVPLAGLFYYFTRDPLIAGVMAVIMLVAGFLFSAVASYMAGLVGSSNNPISGITIATILSAALLLLLMGIEKTLGPAAAIMLGSVVACAAAIGGDNMQDLKAGHIVGSTPRKQQLMQVIGVTSAALFMAPILNLLHEQYVIGEGLQAPQASLMAAVAQGVFEGGLPWGIIGIGAAIAVAVIIVDLVLEARGSSFRAPVLALAVGIYLPFELSVPILIGGVLAKIMEITIRPQREEDRVTNERNGLLFAAGLITGEALMGILIALALASATMDLPFPLDAIVDAGSSAIASLGGPYHSPIPGLLLLGLVMWLLLRVATRSAKK